MRFEVVTDPIEFQRRTTSLLEDEAKHNLMRGILGNIIADPNAYQHWQLFIISQGLAAVAAGLITKPHHLVLADVHSKDPIAGLVAGLVANNAEVPGVIGNRPTVDWFVDEWERATGEGASLKMAQGVFAVDQVIPARAVSGRARAAVTADSDLVFRWINEFIDEALPDEPRDDDRLWKAVEKRLAGNTSGAYWLWDLDGKPTAMSSHGSPTGSGIRISSVYTPTSERGKGYASALVAAQSTWLLANGYDSCFLFTDLMNPTSNSIYTRIGYRQVGDSAVYKFNKVSPGT